MTFLPIVERELRVAARRPSFYWLRGLLALVAVVKGWEMLDHFEASQVSAVVTRANMIRAVPAPAMAPPLTGADLLHELSWLMLGAAVLLGLLAADSINRERREGTLGLLLLTDLTPREIVLGKLLSSGLTGLAALVGFMPVLMSTVLVGGVSFVGVLVTGIGLATDLFVMLAAGLWMSALFRQRHYAMLFTVGCGAMLTYGAEVFGAVWLGPWAFPWLRVLSLAGWAVNWGPFLTLPLFIVWFALAVAVGWFFVRQAERTLAANWQESPHDRVRKAEPPQDWDAIRLKPPEACAPPARVSWLTNPRPWDADPMRWRVERLGSPEGLVWFTVLVALAAQGGLLGSFMDAQSASAGFWVAPAVGGVLAMLGAGGLMAWAGARFFQDARRQQDIEMLLTTPVGGRDLLSSQWRVLRRALVTPLSVTLVPAGIAGIALTWSCLNHEYDRPWFLLPVIAAAVNLALEMVALCWVGLRFGWHAPNGILAVCGTVGVTQMIPLPLAMGAAWACLEFVGGASFRAWGHGVAAVSLALVFLMAKNIALIAWARASLRRDLRTGERTSLNASAPNPVLQPA